MKKMTEAKLLEILRHLPMGNDGEHVGVREAIFGVAVDAVAKVAVRELRDAIDGVEPGSDVVVLDKKSAKTILQLLAPPKKRPGNPKIASPYLDFFDISVAHVTEPSKKTAYKMAQIWKVEEPTARKRIAAAFKVVANK